MMREEVTTVIADQLGPQLLRIEEQLTRVVSLKDKVTELDKDVQYTADTQQQLTPITLPALRTSICRWWRKLPLPGDLATPVRDGGPPLAHPSVDGSVQYNDMIHRLLHDPYATLTKFLAIPQHILI